MQKASTFPHSYLLQGQERSPDNTESYAAWTSTALQTDWATKKKCPCSSSWLLVACIIDIFKLSFINTLAWYFKCFLPEVVKNSIFKNEIIESLRRQAVILICPFKTRRAVVGAEHNVFSANLTLCLRNPSQGSPNSMLHSSQTTTSLL